jgi:signal transduction histidine kinase
LLATKIRIPPQQSNLNIQSYLIHRLKIGIFVTMALLKVRSAEKIRLLTEVSQRIASILDVDELLLQVVRLIQQTFSYYHVGIGVIEGEEVVYRVGAGDLWDRADFQFKPARLKVGKEGITGWVVASGCPLLIPDVSQDQRYVWMQGSETRSELTVPILVKGQVIGALDIQSQQLNDFDATDLELMQALANQTGVAIDNARLFAAEKHRADQFRVLTEVSQRITSILEIDELLRQMVKLVQRTFGYYHIKVGLIEGEDLVFQVGAGSSWEQPGSRTRPSRLKVGSDSIAGWVAANKKLFVTPDVRKEPRAIYMQGSQVLSKLTVPILTKEQVIGVLDVESDRLNAFDETDVELITSLADQVGIAIENAHLYENASNVAVLEERQRLARELHDSVTQSLYGITLYSQAAACQLAVKHHGEVDKLLDEINATAQEALAEMRLLIYQLRPPVLEKEGLLSVLQARLTAVEGRAGLKTSLRSNLEIRLPFVLEEGLSHIAQEALNNTLKHARAHSVNVTLRRYESRVSLEIIDDGIGFDVASAFEEGKLGLPGMQARASELGGSLTITSATGQGTRVRVEVNL